MTNNVKVFDFKQSNIRTIEIEDEVWFVATDVANTLNLSNTTMALNRLDDDERSKFNLGRQGEVNIISEAGLYSFIGSSRKKEAKKFMRWVNHEVLPSIRKTGSYQSKPVSATQQARLALEASVELDDRVTKLEENVVINPTDYGTIGVEVNRRVNGYVQLHHIPKENRHLLFEDLNGQIKKITGARNRSRIKSKDYGMVMDFIERWQPTTATVMQAEQTELDV
ncbi:BRO family protein [Weissella paramesenteroides]|uniref:BRO family protein n=1 Tax=Weissella paramesenteroides TaxID=1249 RepID=UPI003F746700